MLLHGFTGSGRGMLEFVGEWHEGPTLAIDLPGHADSGLLADPALYEMSTCVDAMAEGLRALDLGRCDWFGYSMGARVALQLAVAAPDLVASMVLVGASPGLPDATACAERRRRDNTLADRIVEIGVPSFVREWQALPLFSTQPDRVARSHAALQREERLAQHPLGLALSLRGMGTGAMRPLRDDDLRACTAPVLLLAGELDPKFRALGQALAQAIPGGEFACVPDAGHAAHIENPVFVRRRVRAFWSLIRSRELRRSTEREAAVASTARI